VSDELEPVLSKFQKSRKAVVHRSQLTNADYNPRTITKQAAKRLRESIKSHGLVGGITWNQRTGNIVGGHQRIEQLDQLESSSDYHLEVDVIDVSESEEREINIALNNRTMQGEYDTDKLADLMMGLHHEGRNVERTGFTKHDQFVMLGDECLTGEMARQRDAEKPHIEKIKEVREIGDLYEPPESQIGRDESNIIGDDNDSQEGNRSLAVDAEYVDVDVDDSDEPKKDYTEELKQRRKDYPLEIADEEDGDVIVSLVFDNAMMVNRFLKTFGLDHTKRYFDRMEIEEAFKVELS
jgi:hypothetical protein